ncbi:MAG: GntR family transcriptional regulator [Oscillospiraceae bacterium]|nr:GntR family transcriptional regulator [Oscillospiraceae bacterium]
MFTIDAMSRQPVSEQLVDQAERFILTGILKAGDQIPSVRNLSAQLYINPNTIQKAFSELGSRGLTQAVPGRGSFIAEDAAALLSKRKRSNLTALDRMLEELALAGAPQSVVEEHVRRAYQSLEIRNQTEEEKLYDPSV